MAAMCKNIVRGVKSDGWRKARGIDPMEVDQEAIEVALVLGRKELLWRIIILGDNKDLIKELNLVIGTMDSPIQNSWIFPI